jgi:type I pantothenate kinase
VDAPEVDTRRWYIERFLLLRATAFKEPASYFHRYAALSDEAPEQVAGEIWGAINGPNLRENILPTRDLGWWETSSTLDSLPLGP